MESTSHIDQKAETAPPAIRQKAAAHAKTAYGFGTYVGQGRMDAGGNWSFSLHFKGQEEVNDSENVGEILITQKGEIIFAHEADDVLNNIRQKQSGEIGAFLVRNLRQ